MLKVGELLLHRYEVREVIGRGGMATVYAVFDRRLRTTHALKEAHINSAAERDQFEREARMLAPLRHAALPRVIDHFEDGGRWFLVMELIPGNDLAQMLTVRSRPFEVERVLQWADELLDALDYLHTRPQPIIHRDIKPSNLKLSESGSVILLDFGIAKAHLAGTKTVGSAKAFSYAYSPPEQLGAEGHTDARSDIYALGATLYQLLAGKPPPSAIERAQGAALPSLSAVNADCPAALAETVARAMALQPERRYGSAREMRDALRSVGRGAAPTQVASSAGIPTRQVRRAAPAAAAARPDQPPAGVRPGAPRRAGGVLVLVLALLAIAAALVLLVPSALRGALPTSGAQPTAAQPAAAQPTVAAPTSSAPTPAISAAAVPQTPRAVTASGTADPGIDASGEPVTYAAANVADGRLDTTWRVRGDGVGESLTLEFDRPIVISAIQLVPGYAKIDPIDGTDRFFQNRRVRQVRFEFDDGSAVEATFEEVAQLQLVRFEPVRSSRVTVVILATTDPGEADGGRDFTPISEIVVLGRPADP